MNCAKTLFLSILIATALHAKDASVRRERKEGEAFAKDKRPSVAEKGDQLGFSEQELLPLNDRGKTFNPKEAESQFKNLPGDSVVSELSDFLQKAAKREQVEETDKIFALGQAILEDPQTHLGGMAMHSRIVPEEERLETCQEEGSYRAALAQTLIVEVTPEVKRKVKHCKGHKRKKELFWNGAVDDRVRKMKKEFSKDPTIASYEVYPDKHTLDKSAVIMKWTHVDGTEACDSYRLEETVIESQKEIDRWVADNPQLATHLESSPVCKLLYFQIVQGPETRVIQGKSVYRDVWKRQLFFSCEPHSISRCAQLRQQGGILVRKKCLQENAYKECDLWEKVYDLGGKAAHEEKSLLFTDPALSNLNNTEDASYNKNGDFGKAITTLSVFSDLERSLERLQTDFADADARVFSGEGKKCTRSFLNGDIYDCCTKMQGLAVKAKMAHCNTEEQSLAEQRNDGKCHYIGSHTVKLGTQTEQVYCCFPTKLARIIHEEGRRQLEMKWGTPSKPKCRGLTVEELQKIDFSILDLSEALDDFHMDKARLAGKIQDTLKALEAKPKEELQAKTQKVIEKERALRGIE